MQPSEDCFEQKIAKRHWYFAIKGHASPRLCMARQKWGLLGNLTEANTGRFASFATFPVLRSFSEGGCENCSKKTSAHRIVTPSRARNLRSQCNLLGYT